MKRLEGVMPSLRRIEEELHVELDSVVEELHSEVSEILNWPSGDDGDGVCSMIFGASSGISEMSTGCGFSSGRLALSHAIGLHTNISAVGGGFFSRKRSILFLSGLGEAGGARILCWRISFMSDVWTTGGGCLSGIATSFLSCLLDIRSPDMSRFSIIVNDFLSLILGFGVSSFLSRGPAFLTDNDDCATCSVIGCGVLSVISGIGDSDDLPEMIAIRFLSSFSGIGGTFFSEEKAIGISFMFEFSGTYGIFLSL